MKTTLKARHVNHFVEFPKDFPELTPSAYRGKCLFGAVANLKADESSDVYAERLKLFVIRATGSSASIPNSVEFSPRAFGP